MTNPFAQPAPQPQQPGNPFGAPAPAPAQPQQPAPGGNPFGAPQPPQQPGNPFGAPAPQQPAPMYPGQPAALAQPVQQQPAAPAPMLDPNAVVSVGAPVVGEGRGATLPDMFGRLVMFLPLKIERVPRRPEHISAEQRAAGNTMQDRLTATVVVLDDGNGGQQPIAYGGKPHVFPPQPHTDSAPLPYVRKGMWINQSRLITQLQPHLPQTPGAAPGMPCGRITKAGPQQSDPWFMTPATEQDLLLVRQYMEAVRDGYVPNPLA